MEGLREFLEFVREKHLAKDNLPGILVIAIGCRIRRADRVLSEGSNWRVLAELLRQIRWDRHQVTELGQEVKDLPPKDRTKFWYVSISKADLTSVAARENAVRLANQLAEYGFQIEVGRGK
ncbi:hypothetical protein KIH39_03700 [Telmatocola sphagniphila]|uniref:Uncharacterized protein n=1 Tax=Telmatocola sphagniphila TaxID=1123043 RepID=A0A8E6B7Z5_9BACT|nr:hypothetical protein [Telmatocola sphagniphila]QVL33032.1 hypothetical protein KIH39_03700 [Telmatocola sphagniphila]